MSKPLVAPPGYYQAIAESEVSAEVDACGDNFSPFIEALVFRSKYEGSDKARDTFNPASYKAYKENTASITAFEKSVYRWVENYQKQGDLSALDCAVTLIHEWADADALMHNDSNHTGKSMRKWALGSVASAYLRLKLAENQPLKRYPLLIPEIENWFSRLAQQVVLDWDNPPLEKMNNHEYWAAWSVVVVSIVVDRRDLFEWSIAQYRIAMTQIDQRGFLPNELKRKTRALAYHNYSLNPLAMIAVFAKANQVALDAKEIAALARLAAAVQSGLDDPALFEKATAEKQNLEDLRAKSKFAWLEPYCSLYSCTEKEMAWLRSLRPLKTYRLGGNLTRLFENQKSTD